MVIKIFFILAVLFLFQGCNGETISPKSSVNVFYSDINGSVTDSIESVNIIAVNTTGSVEVSRDKNIDNNNLETATIKNENSKLPANYRKPPNNNKVIDYDFEQSGGIALDGAIKDSSQHRSGVSAIRFKKTNDALIFDNIPVSEGNWYVISGYMYVTSLPADVMRYYIEYKDENGRGIDIPNYPMFAVSKAGSWEEFILPVYIKKNLNVTQLKLVFRDVGKPDAVNVPKSDVWIDDVSMYAVKDSTALFGMTPPQKKQSFDGSLVKIDSLGNFSVRKADGFQPFLPIIVYPGGKLDDWHKYRDKGFNTIICNTVVEAKKAASLGMYWIWSLFDYGIYDGDENGYARFEREYADLKKNSPNVLDKLLYFYWDNERYHLFDTVKHFSDAIKRIDVDTNGKRKRPFMMQLDFTMANPHYVNDTYKLVDFQSCYANPMVFEANDPQNYQGVEFKGNYDGEFANFAIFENIPGVKVPKTVFVINSPFGDKYLANTAFAAFARGGKGFAYWKDGGSQPKIETKEWWKDFNQTTSMMRQLLPLLRKPHWVNWELNSSLPDDEDGLVVGKRDFGEKNCIITASRSSKAEHVRFTGSGISDGTEVSDYFTGKKVAVWQKNAFELNFTPRGYGVYCWYKDVFVPYTDPDKLPYYGIIESIE